METRRDAKRLKSRRPGGPSPEAAAEQAQAERVRAVLHMDNTARLVQALRAAVALAIATADTAPGPGGAAALPFRAQVEEAYNTAEHEAERASALVQAESMRGALVAESVRRAVGGSPGWTGGPQDGAPSCPACVVAIPPDLAASGYRCPDCGRIWTLAELAEAWAPENDSENGPEKAHS